ACYGIKIDHTERETTGVVGKAERLTWHKAWTMVSTGFSISYTSSRAMREPVFKRPKKTAMRNTVIRCSLCKTVFRKSEAAFKAG
ncbi:hypothetical protein, partial [Escherichia coli]|uniref:hypothetical protein n=1 Tax=Escherichia coli TaxID=562 RepID=UPI001BDBA932